eukprot:4064059-Pleurochrysis_carterae.AAC.1
MRTYSRRATAAKGARQRRRPSSQWLLVSRLQGHERRWAERIARPRTRWFSADGALGWQATRERRRRWLMPKSRQVTRV